MNSLLAALVRPSGFFISKFQHFRFSAFQLLPLLLAPVLCAQSPGDLDWVRTSLSSGNGQADTRAMWVDGNDNLFAVGVFKGTVDLFGTTLTATSETVFSGFVAKFSPNGTPQWVRKIGTDAVTELNAVAGFPNGEILVGGTASGNFASGAVSFSIPGGNGQNALLVKLDANGNAVWGYHTGASGTDIIVSMATTRDGKIAIGGNFISSITLGTTLTTYGNQDGFVARVAADSTFTGGRQFGSISNDILSSIAVDSMNLTLVGLTISSCTGNLNIGVPVPCQSNFIIIAQYTEGSNPPIWYRELSNSSVLRLNKAMAITSRDEVLPGGRYAGSPNIGGLLNLPPPVGVSGHLSKLDRDGQFQWQKQIGDGPVTTGDQVMHNAASTSGVIGVVGVMRSTSAMIDEVQLATSVSQSPYFAMLDPDGHCRWAKKVVGSSVGTGNHVQTYSNSDFVFGGFTSPADFGNGVTIASGSANQEAYVARYHGFPYPEIAVEQAGGGLSNYGTAQDFGNGFTGAPGTTKTFTIRNDGSENLTGITPALGGTSPGDFILDASTTATTLAPGATTTFSVQFSPTAIGARSASVAIASNDYDEFSFVIPLTGTGVLPAVSVAVAPASVAEDGATNLAYTFTRTGPTTSSLTVDFAVSGSAVFGTDYSQSGANAFPGSTGSVTFSSGSDTAVVTLDPTADTGLEADETVILTVAPGSGYEVGSPAAASGTILNDDTEVSLAVAPASMAEDAAGGLVYTFTRVGTTSGALTVNFNVSGTADFGSDYTQSGADSFYASTGTVTFAAGVSTTTVTLDPGADNTVEADETVDLTLAAGSGYQVVPPNAATGTIINDDTDVSVTVSPASVVEDGAGNLVFTFSRVGVTSGPLTVNFNVGGTAIFASDYTQSGAASFSTTSGTVGFTAGQTTKQITLDPSADTTVENDETLALTVVAGSGYNPAAPTSATGTINNDDFPPEIAVEQPSGSGLTSALSSVAFGAVYPNNTVSKTFVIRNLGTLQLSGLVASVIGTNNAEFVPVQPAGSVNGGGNASFTVAFTPTAMGARTATLRIANNDADENPFDIALTGTGATARQVFDAWALAAGLSGLNAEPGATPFKDGVPNLLKYAFNMNATGTDVRTLVPTTGTVGLPVVIFTGGASPVIRYEFIRRKNSGLTYTPQQSSILAAGSWQAMTGTTTVTLMDATWERVVIEQPWQAGSPRLLKEQVVME